MSSKLLRWGLLGTAEIARKNWKAILNSGNGIVQAVASRNLEGSRKFIELCQGEVPFETPPVALGDYASLIDSPEVDAIYLPLPTSLRTEWAVRAAQAGKHLICEKPCANSAADLKRILRACRERNVQFMDGVMFVHSERMEHFLGKVGDGKSVGQVKRIASQFSFRAPPEFVRSNIRCHSELEPLGCLGDLGWYCIRISLLASGGLMPEAVTGRILSRIQHQDGPQPVPAEFSGELFFPHGISASFYCSFVTEHQQWVNVSGTLGHATMSDFVLPFFGDQLEFQVFNPAYTVRSCDFRMDANRTSHGFDELSHGHPSSQESRMFRHFNETVLQGKRNEDWPRVAMNTQLVLDACLASAQAEGRLTPLKN